MLSLTPTFYN